MKKRIVVYILGWLLVFEGFFLMLPCLVGLIYQEVEAVWFAIVALVCLCLGFLLYYVMWFLRTLMRYLKLHPVLRRPERRFFRK